MANSWMNMTALRLLFHLFDPFSVPLSDNQNMGPG